MISDDLADGGREAWTSPANVGSGIGGGPAGIRQAIGSLAVERTEIDGVTVLWAQALGVRGRSR
jgi:hypothetical protein